MSSTLYPVSGCKIYIGNTTMSDKEADFVSGDFSAVTWTEIDGWAQMGAIGDTAALITQPLINRSRDVKQKGTANAGSMQNIFVINLADPGQIALMAAGAATNRSNYPFRVDMNDPGGGGTPSKRYFIGLVMSVRETGGSANTPRNLDSTVEVNSNIVQVAAA